ncbi:MAG: hypothetical protein LAT55_02940 [Opitutales bacterium]|nr:hypothetical protein [Opitutales bacterium]
MKLIFQIAEPFLSSYRVEAVPSVWRKGFLSILLLFSGFSFLQAEANSRPQWVESQHEDIQTAQVLAIEELSEADVVIFSGGYETGYRAGMVGSIEREGSIYAEVLIVEARPKVMAAVIRELEEGYSIQPGDILRPRITRF